MHCLSTHGGCGYAAGSYWDDDVIVCGACGFRIEDPPPTGWTIHTPRVFSWRWPFFHRLSYHEPRWPRFILGKRGEPWAGTPWPDQVPLPSIKVDYLDSPL